MPGEQPLDRHHQTRGPEIGAGQRAAGELPGAADRRSGLDAVLFDRDGTLIVDVPHNGDPARVRALPDAAAAIARCRAAGLRVAVVSNQSAVGRGLITRDQVDAVNRRVEELVGRLDGWFVCPHHPDSGCACRKPEPGLVLAAAHALGTSPERCAVVGDIGADMAAATTAGARAVLVPTPATRPEEVAAAPAVAATLLAALDLLIGPAPGAG